MITSASISVATSLVPNRDHDLQSAAVASWKQLGFSVASLNAPQEASDVQRQFPDVAVITAQRTAAKAAGKPLPLIADMLQAAHENAPTASVIGILNADIILRPLPDLAPALLREASRATVMLPRVDVATLKAATSFAPTGHETYSVGYDGVFMPPALRAAIPESLFCIGMPFWDYWLPLMTLLQGHALKSIASPVALHITHQTRWDRSIYVFFHAMVGDMIKVCAEQKKTATTPALEIMLDVLQHTYNDIFERATAATPDQDNTASMDTLAAFYDRIQEVAVHHIKAKAEAIKVAESAAATS